MQSQRCGVRCFACYGSQALANICNSLLVSQCAQELNGLSSEASHFKNSDGYKDAWGGVYTMIHDYILKDVEDYAERAKTAMELHTEVSVSSALDSSAKLTMADPGDCHVYMVLALDPPQGSESNAPQIGRWQAVRTRHSNTDHYQASAGEQVLALNSC